MLPCVLAKSASYLGWLHLLFEPIDLASVSDRLTVDRVLEPFDHGFKVLEAFLQDLKTRQVLSACIGSDSRWLSASTELSHHAFEQPR